MEVGRPSAVLQAAVPLVDEPRIRLALQRGHHRLVPEKIDKMVRDYQAGTNLSTLGERYGVHRTTVRRHLLLRGVALR